MKNKTAVLFGVAAFAVTLVVAWRVHDLSNAQLQNDQSVSEQPPRPNASIAQNTETQTVDSPEESKTEAIIENNQEDIEQQLLAMGFTQEELTRRRRQEALQQAADQRFEEAVQTDRLSPDQVNAGIKELMKTVLLEPVINPDNTMAGYVDGLQIIELAPRNAFAQAGFKRGDRLIAINGQPLQDPAQIAYLFTQLQQSFEVCAERDGDNYCQFINLAKS